MNASEMRQVFVNARYTQRQIYVHKIIFFQIKMSSGENRLLSIYKKFVQKMMATFDFISI